MITLSILLAIVYLLFLDAPSTNPPSPGVTKYLIACTVVLCLGPLVVGRRSTETLFVFWTFFFYGLIGAFPVYCLFVDGVESAHIPIAFPILWCLIWGLCFGALSALRARRNRQIRLRVKES